MDQATRWEIKYVWGFSSSVGLIRIEVWIELLHIKGRREGEEGKEGRKRGGEYPNAQNVS